MDKLPVPTDLAGPTNTSGNGDNVQMQQVSVDVDQIPIHGEKQYSPGEPVDLVSGPGNESPAHSGNQTIPAERAAQKVDIRQLLLAKQRAMAQAYRSKTAATSVAQSNTNPGTSVAERDDISSDPRPSNDDSEAALLFQSLREQYERQKQAGTLTDEDEIDFMVQTEAEKTRQNKVKQDQEFNATISSEMEEQENPLFVREDSVQPTTAHKQSKKAGRKLPGPFEEVDDNENISSPPAKRRKTAKKRQKVVGTDNMDDGAEVPTVQGRKTSKTNSAKKKQSKDKAKAGGKKAGPAMTNIGSIFGTNVFKDTADVADRPDQPEFIGFTKERKGKRSDGLKQLVAGVSAESKDVAKTDAKAIDDAIKDFTGGGHSVRPGPDGWTVVGMESTLKHYQILGIAFMRRRETSDSLPRGGILADDMGLGKTISMLTNIVNGRPSRNSEAQVTLIVASPALVAQWKSEINKHCVLSQVNRKHGMGRVMVYRSRDNDNPMIDQWTNLNSSEIVLTTWYEVSKSYPKALVPDNLTTYEQKDAWWQEHFAENAGLLHKMKWFRVVLDEAQAIKNHKSHTSMACRALDVIHPWAITGTPIQNRLSEFYPYLKFLGEPNTGSFKLFKKNFCSPDDPEGTEKLNAFLRKVMIRRTHQDTLFGARLLDLPTPKETTIWLEFNDVERQIYEIVKKRFVQRINTLCRKEGIEKQYSHIWSMYLRLRQICGHILLIQNTVMDLLEREDFEKLNRITENENLRSDEGKALLVHLRNVLINPTGRTTIQGGSSNAILTETEAVTVGAVNIEDTEGNAGSTHGLNFRFQKYLKDLAEEGQLEAMIARTKCCGCRQQPYDPHVTSCFHIFCEPCLWQLNHDAARHGHDRAKCSECGEIYSSAHPCKGIEAFMDRATSCGTTEEKRQKTRKKDGKTDWIALAGEVLPSAKTIACKAQILNWLNEDADAKIIVYSQFLPMIRILEKMCVTERWEYCKYHGEMSQDSRTNALTEFGKKPEKKLLLASLQCGGLGLNLTMATRVICIDPWWNNAVEQQAFCRVFRIGQTKETRMTRLVIKNTVDASMMDMKSRKQRDIDEVMEQKKSNLSIEDLLRLFGDVRKDNEGHPFIFADDADRDEIPERKRFMRNDEEDETRFMGNEE